MDREMLLIICVELPGPQAQPDVCPVVSLGRYLTIVWAFMLVSVVDCLCICMSTAAHTSVCYLCVCVLVCPQGDPLTQSASALIPEGADSGAARALPCPPNTRSC